VEYGWDVTKRRGPKPKASKKSRFSKKYGVKVVGLLLPDGTPSVDMYFNAHKRRLVYENDSWDAHGYDLYTLILKLKTTEKMKEIPRGCLQFYEVSLDNMKKKVPFTLLPDAEEFLMVGGWPG